MGGGGPIVYIKYNEKNVLIKVWRGLQKDGINQPFEI